MRKNYIFEYYDAIKSDQIRAGKWIKLVYKLLSEGIKTGRWVFDQQKADRAINFIEQFCRQSKGTSDLIKLALWQKAMLSTLFGIIDKKTGYRQFKEVLLLVGRKNGKSTLAAAIMAYSAYIDGEYGGELYCLAPKLDQADIVFDCFWKMVQNDEELNEGIKKRRSDLYIEELNTIIKKLAFNSKKADGFNPSFVNNDEIEAWRGDQGLKQYEVMVSGTGARNEPIILSTCTGGYENDSIFDELVERSMNFLNEMSDEERLLPLLYVCDDIENWNKREELAKANPNMDISVKWEFFEDEIKIALQSISKRAEFMAKYCNIKQNSAIAWLDFETVDKAMGEAFELDDFKGCYCTAGIDLSKTTDLTAVTLLIEKDGINHVYTKFYMPQDRYKVAIEEESVPYNIFKQQGHLIISGEHQIDQTDLFMWFRKLIKVYKIYPVVIGYDRYCAGYLVNDLTEAGFKTDNVYQGTNLTSTLHTLEGDLKDGKYNIGKNNLLKSHLLNVCVNIGENDSRLKPVKMNKRAHIDGAASLLDALAVKMKYYGTYGKTLKNIKK